MRETILMFLAFCVPIFTVLYWLNAPTGTWLLVLIPQALVTLIYVLSMIAGHRVMISVNATEISERGFLRPFTAFPRAILGRVVLLDLYTSSSLDTIPQLFVTDTDGKLLVRMRGQFWSHDDMEALADDLDIPVMHVPEPVTLADLNRLRPELLYWFERRLNLRRSGRAFATKVTDSSEIISR
ncbi:hypothetical protein [Cryobacterium psychrophilum]|uniref:PH domain-containing protein n=1 Tax=Cryobacterium psychrophilum TaxID=41988 RepID=A0A4Y8KPE2_9MICO|nr:hypothetical protein [Cryobacterium psychrophilum]TFD76311.1 hypothetical protein E3T53_13985 [Cryobacterium psychrophilum]